MPKTSRLNASPQSRPRRAYRFPGRAARIARAVTSPVGASPPPISRSTWKSNRPRLSPCNAGCRTVSDPSELTLQGPRVRDPPPQGLVRRSHQGAARSYHDMAAEAQRVRAGRGRGRAESREGRRPRARGRKSQGSAARRAARAQGHVLREGQARRMRLEDPQRMDRAHDLNRASRGSKRPARSGSARSTWWSSPSVRPGTIPTPVMSAIHGIARTSPAARRPAPARRSARGLCRRRSAPIPAARSACRRISAA